MLFYSRYTGVNRTMPTVFGILTYTKYIVLSLIQGAYTLTAVILFDYDYIVKIRFVV